MEVPQHEGIQPKKSEKKTMEVETIKKTEAPKEVLLFGDEDVDKMFGMITERDQKAVEHSKKEMERTKMQTLLSKDLVALENYLQMTENLNELSQREDMQKMLKINTEMEGLAKTLREVSLPMNKDSISPENLKALRESLARKTEEAVQYKAAEAQYDEVKKTQEALAPAWAEAKDRMLYFYDKLPARDQQALTALTLMSGDEDFAKKYIKQLPEHEQKILEVAPEMMSNFVKRRLNSEMRNEQTKMKIQGEDPLEILHAMENIAVAKKERDEALKKGDQAKAKALEGKIALNQGLLGTTGVVFTEQMNDAKHVRSAITQLENGQMAAARGLMAMTANEVPEENTAERAKVNAAKNNVFHTAAAMKWQKYAKSQQTKQ